MTVDLEAIRAEVVKRHNLILGHDDPVLVTATICDVALTAFLGQIEASAARLEQKGASLMAQELTEVKKAAERLISGASGYVASEVRSAGDEARRGIVLAVDEALKAAKSELEKVNAAKQTALYAAYAAVAAAVLAFGIALGALLK